MLNPLYPNIHKQILSTDLYTLPEKSGGENLFEDQSILPQVMILLINTLQSYDYVMIK